jgi:N-acetyl-anhydromuramyl-L-alanine amidase AmpD
MRHLVLLSLAILVASCGGLPIVDDEARYQNERINYLVIHFTSEHFARSLELLTGRGESRVSVHYLVPEPGDETYPRGDDLRIYRLVREERRAWHAGTSSWGGTTYLNSSSIGIEIVNQSACVNDPDVEPPTPETQNCTLLEFPDEQIELVIRLAQDILERNPDINPVDVVGHGDIAPDRRVDPGPMFPWKRLYDHGIGAWYDENTAARYRRQFNSTPPDLATVQRALSAYGYPIEPTGEDDTQSRFAVRAFQMHFRQAAVTGYVDIETASIIFSLLDKYRPGALDNLLQITPI